MPFELYDKDETPEVEESLACVNCEQLYKIVHATEEKPLFCPFCSEPLE